MALSQDRDVVLLSKGFVHYHGRPAWMATDILEALNDEAAGLRGRAQQVERQAHSPVGPQGRGVAGSPKLLDLIARHVGPAKPSGNANYLYYDCPSAGIDPHIDSPDFPLQILLMLTHEGFPVHRRSSLVVFPTGPRDAVPVVLEPGELVLFSAASVYHGRSNVSPGERLVLLGIGYCPDASVS